MDEIDAFSTVVAFAALDEPEEAAVAEADAALAEVEVAADSALALGLAAEAVASTFSCTAVEVISLTVLVG